MNKEIIKNAIVTVLFFGFLVWVSIVLGGILEEVDSATVGYGLMVVKGFVILLFFYGVAKGIAKRSR